MKFKLRYFLASRERVNEACEWRYFFYIQIFFFLILIYFSREFHFRLKWSDFYFILWLRNREWSNSYFIPYWNRKKSLLIPFPTVTLSTKTLKSVSDRILCEKNENLNFFCSNDKSFWIIIFERFIFIRKFSIHRLHFVNFLFIQNENFRFFIIFFYI